MPYPEAGEDKKAYISRFMASEEAQKDFPEEKQRLAVAYSLWEKRNRTNATGDSGWPKLYSCTFIEPGVVFYQDLGEKGETILVQKPALDKMMNSFVGKPVINFVHKDVTPDTVANGDADGIVSRVWFDDASGWYKCEFLVWDELTQRNCESQGVYSVSCAYEPTEVESKGGSYHNMPYQEEVLNGEYTHLAVVANPRYEGARIFVNSKGGSEMQWKFWAAKATKKNAADLDPKKSLVDVDGEKVSLEQLYDAVKPGESTLEMSDDTVFEVDGKEHTLGSMKEAHRNKLKSAKEAEEKKNAEDKKNGESEAELKSGEKAKNDQAEEAAKKSASEAKEKSDLELQQAADKDAADKKAAEEKKNAEDAEAKKKEDEKRNAGRAAFTDLKNTASRARQGDPVSIKLVTQEERIAVGKEKYGSAPK